MEDSEMPEVLTWSDDFRGAAGQPPSLAKWAYDVGPGNQIGGPTELEVYRQSTKNAYLDGQGHLVIAATEENGTYYSARLKTLGIFSQYQGTMQARIKCAPPQGCWPAWWMMGDGGWPRFGEVDIYEAFGHPGWPAGSTVWYPNASGTAMETSSSASFALDANWHVYQVVWDSKGFHFSQDGVTYLNVSPASPYVPGNQMYMVLNMAVGGTGGGDPAETIFPVTMEVDYVRVYQWQA
jgi:beta-glucanase (GH16 family)